MSEQTRIMYVCSECVDDAPESCGHFDRKDLRVMPDGRWLYRAQPRHVAKAVQSASRSTSGDAMILYGDLAARIERGDLKALSIRQPYPHHIFHDGKDVENRDWATRGRGWFIVHAGVNKSELDKEDERHQAMPRGGVVGMARIVDCVTKMDSVWFNGPYGFVLRDAFPLPLITCKGALGFFALPSEVCRQVAEAVRTLGTTELSSQLNRALASPATPAPEGKDHE